MNWQPIETAPKDGTRVLFYHPGDKRSFYERDESQRWWVDYWSGTAWYRTAPDAQPTHWMPLPPPPEALGALSHQTLTDQGGER